MAPTSLNDLNNEAAIDGDLVAVLAYESCEEIVAQANEIRINGITKLNAGKKIEAYVLLMRFCNLAGILEMVNNKNLFIKSQEGQAFVKTIESVKAELLVLSNEVERLIYDSVLTNVVDSNPSLNNETQNKSVIKGPYDCDENDKFFLTIEPLEFVTLAKDNHRILLVDFRLNTTFFVNFFESTDFSNTTVAMCHPQFITPHLPLVYLSRVLPESERSKFLPEVITQYDFVVLMNDDDPIYNDDKELVPPALDIVMTLTSHVSTQVKRKPMFIKGGFNKWRQDCGVYVSEKIEGETFSEKVNSKNKSESVIVVCENETVGQTDTTVESNLKKSVVSESNPDIEIVETLAFSNVQPNEPIVKNVHSDREPVLPTNIVFSPFKTTDCDSTPSTPSTSTSLPSASADSGFFDAVMPHIDQTSFTSKITQFTSFTLEFTRHNDVIVRADDSYTGSVVFPAYISFKDSTPVVGKVAQSQRQTHPDSVVYDIPRLLSIDFDPNQSNHNWGFSTSRNHDDNIVVYAGKSASTPFILFATILKSVVSSVQKHFPKPIDCVSVKLPTVPRISKENLLQLCSLLNCNVVILN